MGTGSFIAGLLLGALLGIFMSAFCIVAKEADEEAERMWREHHDE